MKIVHVISSIDPRGGGPPQVIVRLAAAQAALGHDVHVVAYGDPDADRRVADQLARVPRMSDVRLHVLPPADRAERLLPRRARRALAGIVPGAGWVHLHGVWETILLAAASAARRAGVPYCFRPAGMLEPWSLAQRAWKKKLALALGTRRALSAAAFIHALNDEEAELIDRLRLGPPSRVIPNGVFLEEVEPLPPAGAFHARHPELAGRPFVLFLSRLHYKKGLDFLADAFAIVAPEHPDVHLVVAGPDGGERAPFEARVAAHGLSGRVHLVGGLYDAAKYAALVDAACFCLPSRQEGFSVAVLEALAAGAPVVISPACHFPDVDRCGAGRVVDLDPAPLAAALDTVLADPALRSSMSAAGKQLIRSRYTWPRIAEQTLVTYNAAAAAAADRRPLPAA